VAARCFTMCGPGQINCVKIFAINFLRFVRFFVDSGLPRHYYAAHLQAGVLSPAGPGIL
jgi:hypothetical protein